MKRIFYLLLVFTVFCGVIPVYGENAGNDDNYVAIYMDSYSDDIGSYLDGRNIKGRIMISAFGVDWGFGAKVKYGSNANEIIFARADKTIVMRTDSNVMLVNGSSVIMDCKPVTIEGKIYVPLKYLYEALGCQVEWDPQSKVVNIHTGDMNIGMGAVTYPLNGESLLTKVKEENIYKTNYIEEYKDVLDRMFPSGWKVESEKQFVRESFETCEHYTGDIYVFTMWEISYTDKNNEKRIFDVSNIADMNKNIENYLLDMFESYYMDNYVNKYFNNENISVNADFSLVGENVPNGRKEAEEACETYISNLTNEAVDLSKLNMNEIYEKFPVYTDININCDTTNAGNVVDKQSIVDNAYNRAEEMVSEIISDTGNKANIELYVNALGDKSFEDQKNYREFYVAGEKYTGNPSVLVYMSDLTYEVYKDTLYKR